MKTECDGDYVRLKGKKYPCTVSLTMDLVGGKWKAVILYHLKDSEKRYSELRKEMPAITEMTLSLQLKQLEKEVRELRMENEFLGKATALKFRSFEAVEHRTAESPNERDTLIS